MTSYDDMTTSALRGAVAAMAVEIERREAEDAARQAVADAVQAYADAEGLTMLQAWRVLVPKGVEVPPDPEPEPVPNAPEYVPPTGAHDAYMAGDLVTFRGTVYRCRIDGCAWSPLAYPQGWEVI